MQRLLPLQPGITQQFGVLTTADATNYPIDNAMAPQTVEYKSILTEENLRNHLSEETTSNVSSKSMDISSSSAQNAVAIASTSEHTKCDSEIESCDIMIDSDGNKPSEYFTSDLDSDEEENNRIRQRLNEDPGIQSLMEISLPSPIPINHSADECESLLFLVDLFFVLFVLYTHPFVKYMNIFSIPVYTDSVESQPSISPMRILRESPVPADAKWFEENMNDFSLSSFLGHLEANCDQSNSRRSRSPRCVSIPNESIKNNFD